MQKTSKFFVSVPKNFVGEHFGVSENFGYRQILCIRKGYHYFPLKFFCLTAERFRGEPFCDSEKFWYGKILWIRGGGGE